MAATQAPPTPIEAVEGGQAFERGLPITANPYQGGSQQHEDWAWGWTETEYRIDYESQIED